MRTTDRASGINVRTKRTALTDNFTIVPNDLFYGRGTYACLSPLARLLLGAGLACKDGWETTLEEIQKFIPGAGRDKHEALRRELRQHGFLSMSRSQYPAGHPKAGKYVWTLQFLMDPLPPEERDDLQKRKDPMPASPMPGFSGHRGADENAGQPMPGSPGHPGPGHPHPGPGEPGDVKEEKNHEVQEPNPPYPPDDSTASDDGQAGTRGGNPSRFDEQTQAMLATAVGAAVSARTVAAGVGRAWTRELVREAMTLALDAGREPDVVAWAIVRVAQDPATSTPKRMLQDAWLDAALLERFVPAPREKPRCPKPAHQSWPADNCGACKVDEKVAAVEKARATAELEEAVVPA